MTSQLVPYEKLHGIREQLGLSDSDLQRLDPFRRVFVEQGDRFAQYFYDVFREIPETRFILEHEGRPGLMKKTWASWFRYVFTTNLDDALLGYLWQVGVRHVQVNLDQRYSNLGFSLVRQFCHEIVLSSETHSDQATLVLSVVDKMLDLCLLIETEAYITHTTRCDLEVMKEVADRVRNPVLVIGGNLRRMQKKLAAGSKEYELLQRLYMESQRLESMVRDIKVYMDTFQNEPEVQEVVLQELVKGVVERVRGEDPETRQRVEVELAFDEDAGCVSGDPVGLRLLFYYIFENSFDAAAPQAGRVRVSTREDENDPANIQVEIFNSGSVPAAEDIGRLFAPFFTTKIAGTGFGLPIASLVARKHFGKIDLQSVPGGTRTIVTLPRCP